MKALRLHLKRSLHPLRPARSQQYQLPLQLPGALPQLPVLLPLQSLLLLLHFRCAVSTVNESRPANSFFFISNLPINCGACTPILHKHVDNITKPPKKAIPISRKNKEMRRSDFIFGSSFVVQPDQKPEPYGVFLLRIYHLSPHSFACAYGRFYCIMDHPYYYRRGRDPRPN